MPGYDPAWLTEYVDHDWSLYGDRFGACCIDGGAISRAGLPAPHADPSDPEVDRFHELHPSLTCPNDEQAWMLATHATELKAAGWFVPFVRGGRKR